MRTSAFDNTKGIWIVLILVLIAIPITCSKFSSEHKDIEKWVSDRGDTATNIEFRGWNIGPYWHDKNASVYHVDTVKSNIYWFKYTIFGRKVYIETNPGQYEKVED